MGSRARHPFHRSSGQRCLLGLRKNQGRQNGWAIPVFLQKPESDANFEMLTAFCSRTNSIVTAAFGSHNVRSIAHAQAMADQLGIDRSRFEFQLLYGMAGPIKRALVEMGYRVREYCPVGELLPGMSYLVRRLLENTSNEGFFRAKFSDNVSAAELLRDPKNSLSDSGCVRASEESDSTCNGTSGPLDSCSCGRNGARIRHPVTPTKMRRS